MSQIQSFKFDSAGFEDIKNHPLGQDWPVVYIIENRKEVYIGETTSAFNRSKEHSVKENRARLTDIHLIIDEEFNKSAILDLEAQLIQYFSAEGSLKIQNANRGLENHNFFDKARYRGKLASIWQQLQKMMLVTRGLEEIENSELFKYSPYKALTPDQLAIADTLYESIKSEQPQTHIVNGGPGTGKTILATYLIKLLAEDRHTRHLKVGLVVPMTSLRRSLQNVFSAVSGLSSDMVIGPSAVQDQKYDLLIVDEAHRLRQRKNITNYRSHDQMNRRFGLGNEGTELDWVLRSAPQHILLYDENQSIRPADVHSGRFESVEATRHYLKSQVRVKGGEKYIEFINDLFAGRKDLDTKFQNFDFQIFDDVGKMVEKIKEKDTELGLSRVVAGFAWPWISRDNPDVYDIEIGDVKLRWNSTTANWVNSKNAVNEVGCIHTIQGYDLNYVGVIVGPELGYESSTDRLVVNKEKYEDGNGWHGVDDPADLERYIVNIYKTLMTRGMRGCFLYFVDKETERYFKSRLGGSRLD